MKRIRCCGRFCFWRHPLGPWRCGECGRDQDGKMPKSAYARFDEWAEAERVKAVAMMAAADPQLVALFFETPQDFYGQR